MDPVTLGIILAVAGVVLVGVIAVGIYLARRNSSYIIVNDIGGPGDPLPQESVFTRAWAKIMGHIKDYADARGIVLQDAAIGGAIFGDENPSTIVHEDGSVARDYANDKTIDAEKTLDDDSTQNVPIRFKSVLKTTHPFNDVNDPNFIANHVTITEKNAGLKVTIT